MEKIKKRIKINRKIQPVQKNNSMQKTIYLCSNCGYKTSKWLGKCPDCGSWNTFIEEFEETSKKEPVRKDSIIRPVSISDIQFNDNERLFSKEFELDRVLGGIVPGQAILLSGEPGIGKSTLILSIANRIAENKKVYYINGEESNSQVKVRAKRISADSKNLFLVSVNNTDDIAEIIKKDKPEVVLIDSIQTLYSERFSSLPGSIVQIRESSFTLVSLCKEMNIPLILIGHITKSGSIAGPKIIEHIVDTVIFLETDNRGYYRILRSLKNRFFSTDEVGLFTMEETGLKGIENDSTAFTFMHPENVSGIAIFPLLEGSRVFPVEIQALCSPSQFNYPKRTSDGMDINRLYMLIAIMEKRLKVNLASNDVFLNITNGLKINDPSLDLAVITALYSSLKDIPSPVETAVFGEVGLTGEVRPVQRPGKRISEMSRLGMKKIIIPYQDLNQKQIFQIQQLPVKSIEETISALF